MWWRFKKWAFEAGTEVMRRSGLAQSADVVALTLDGQQRRVPDRAWLDPAAAVSQFAAASSAR